MDEQNLVPKKTHHYEPELKVEPGEKLQEQDKKRVLVPLDQETYEAIKNALHEFSKEASFKVSVPDFLSRIIRRNWQREIRHLKALDGKLRYDLERIVTPLDKNVP